MGNHVNEERYREVLELREQKVPYKVLAQKYGLSIGRVGTMVKDAKRWAAREPRWVDVFWSSRIKSALYRKFKTKAEFLAALKANGNDVFAMSIPDLGAQGSVQVEEWLQKEELS
jgi:hypothetical protein